MLHELLPYIVTFVELAVVIILIVQRNRVQVSDEMLQDVIDIKRNQKNFNLHMYRSQLQDQSLDIYSRLEAGIEYMRLGGNGQGKTQLLNLAKENKDAWDTVCRNSRHIKALKTNFFEDAVNDIQKLLDYKSRTIQ